MATKKDYQNTLKDKFDVNINISQKLSRDDCESMIALLEKNPAAISLVKAYIDKNTELSNNNRVLGKARSTAEKKRDSLQEDYDRLLKNGMTVKTVSPSKETDNIQAEVNRLQQENSTLQSKNKELLDSNKELKKDNKQLKNIVDLIKLRFAQGVHKIVRKDDNEIRQELAKLLESTLG